MMLRKEQGVCELGEGLNFEDCKLRVISGFPPGNNMIEFSFVKAYIPHSTVKEAGRALGGSCSRSL